MSFFNPQPTPPFNQQSNILDSSGGSQFPPPLKQQSSLNNLMYQQPANTQQQQWNNQNSEMFYSNSLNSMINNNLNDQQFVPVTAMPNSSNNFNNKNVPSVAQSFDFSVEKKRSKSVSFGRSSPLLSDEEPIVNTNETQTAKPIPQVVEHTKTVSFFESPIYSTMAEDDMRDDAFPAITFDIPVRSGETRDFSNVFERWQNMGLGSNDMRHSFVATTSSHNFGFEDDFGTSNKPTESILNKGTANTTVIYPNPNAPTPSELQSDTRSELYNPNAIPTPISANDDQDDEDESEENQQESFDMIQLGLLDPKELKILCENISSMLNILYKYLGTIPTECSLVLLEKHCESNLKDLSKITNKHSVETLISLLISRLDLHKNKGSLSKLTSVDFLEQQVREIARTSLINLREDMEGFQRSKRSSTPNDSSDEVSVASNNEPELPNIPRKMVEKKKLIDKLLKQISSINTPLNDNGDTIVHACCWYGLKSVLEYAHKVKGALLSIRNKDGKLPLEYAINQHRISSTVYLIGNSIGHSLHLFADGRLRETFNRDLILEGKKKNLTKALRQCISSSSRVKPNVKDEYGMTPLHYSVLLRYDSTIKKLLQMSNIRVNERDKLKRTCLHLAAISNNTEVIDMLCKRVDIDRLARDDIGDSFLHTYIRYIYAEENGPKYENPILVMNKIQSQFKWFRSPIVDCGLILAHAGCLEKLNHYHDFVISCWNQIVKYGLSDSYIIVENSLLEGIVDPEVVKTAIITSFKQFIIPPKRNDKRPLRLQLVNVVHQQEKQKKGLFSFGRETKSLLGMKNKEQPPVNTQPPQNTPPQVTQQIIDVMSKKIYNFSMIDFKDLQYLFTDNQTHPQDSYISWMVNNQKQTPLSLAIVLIRALVKEKKVQAKSIVTLPIRAFKI
ncbi:predicted protein [Naegleria gruberi]|uniref:Predicted protein n=1 Tax=Naegleria gruberi TaxID=5762 RepID=D2V0H8_NAEGR|nr:uncharacterized protein NAEGRDRAFT_45703 [Naegleria gruberi]EFC49526.1 predicted protein [Naegleria gruberi]|eukprot:XP_002682270.1 predicted protein [Naegleria gruberi strain NEG-M]